MSEQDSKVGGASRGRGLYRWVLLAVVATAVVGTTMAVRWNRRPPLDPFEHVDGPRCENNTFPLTETESPLVVGWGDNLGVTVRRQNEARFEFQISDLTARYSIEFSAAGVEDQKDVDISLNGIRIATVTPHLKKQHVKLRNRYLGTVIPNEIGFDHVANPPRAKPWAISKLKLVVEPGP